MKQSPDPSKMTEQQRADWHDSRSNEPRRGKAVKRHTRTTADAHLSVRLYPDQIARLRQLANSEGVSVSALVRKITEEELNRRLPADSPTRNALAGVVTGLSVELTGSGLPEDVEHEFLWIA